MSETVPHQIALLGLGNLMRTDDAVGMLALHRLTEDGRLPNEIRVIEGETLGLDLLESLRGISHLLVFDAVDTGVIPGTLLRFEGDEIDNLPVSKSVHLLGFSDLMCALRLMDAAPEKVVLLGVQPASTDWGTVLTSEVDLALQSLMQSALAQVAQWIIEASALAARPQKWPGDFENHQATIECSEKAELTAFTCQETDRFRLLRER
jgi:hydrogenase maturation protease